MAKPRTHCGAIDASRYSKSLKEFKAACIELEWEFLIQVREPGCGSVYIKSKKWAII